MGQVSKNSKIKPVGCLENLYRNFHLKKQGLKRF